MKTEIRNLDDLTIHPALKSQPRLTDDELLAWRRGMKRRGESATPPLYVTAENQIVDGRHRYWCARKLGWQTVPVQVIPAGEVFTTIFETLTNRRHYTKGQMAYIVAPLVLPVFEEAKKRMLAGTKDDPLHSVQRASETPESLAQDLGISYRVLAQAQEIHEFFREDSRKRTLTDRDGNEQRDVTFKEFFEPRILLAEDPEAPRTRAYGLGAVLAGIKQVLSQEQHAATRPHRGGRPERVDKQLQLFSTALHGLENKFEYWRKWDEDTRADAAKKIPLVFEQMPDDLLAEFARAAKTELKRREK